MLWFPAVAIAAHLVEEFVWPGGFPVWYRHYPPGATATVTPRLLVIVNAVFVALALMPPIFGPTARGLAFWMVVVAIAAINGVFHLVATLRTRTYSPGVVTGALLYLPLAVAGGTSLVRDPRVAPGTIAEAIVIAIAYQLWSSWNHRRHTLTLRAS
jgi:hypothetical protein